MSNKKIISCILALMILFSALLMNFTEVKASGNTNEITVKNASELTEAVKTDGAKISLANDIILEGTLVIDNTVTIEGNGHTISGEKMTSGQIIGIKVNNGTATFNNIKFTKFDNVANLEAAPQGTIIMIDEGHDNAKVIASGLTIDGVDRNAFSFKSGSFEVKNTVIDCKPTLDRKNVLSKGFQIGFSKNKVNGVLENVTVTNSASNYEEWTSSAIEIYNNATVRIIGGKIEKLNYGIFLDNYWGGTSYYPDLVGNTNVTVEGVTINANEDAIVLMNNEDKVNDFESNLDIISGTYNGNVAIYNTNETGNVCKELKKDNINILGGTFTGNIFIDSGDKVQNKEQNNITISAGTFKGEVAENVKLAENVILEKQSDGSQVARIDNTELKDLVAKYESVKNDGYTTTTWNNFVKCQTSAKEVLNNVNATKAEIDEAIKNLTNAYKALEKTPAAPEKTEVKVETDVEVAVDSNVSEVVNSNDKVVEYINKGVEVNTEIEIKDAKPSDEVKTTISNAAPKATIGKYLDINILVKDAATNKQIDKITELSEEVEFTIELDEELKNVPEGFERVYKVIRMHDGKAEAIETVLSEDKNYITFSTDKFSIYAISYEDTKIKGTDGSENGEQDNKEETDKEDEEIVQTGDYIYIAVGIFAVVLVANIAYFIKKRNK